MSWSCYEKVNGTCRITQFGGKKVGIIGAVCSGIMFSMYAKHLLAEVHIFNRGEMRRNFVLDRKLLEEYEVSALTEVENYRNIFEIVMLVVLKQQSE
ncbi:hypothetical protein [Xenorhabdus sp. TH1]|uniref:hypothetical protein n=1 Tax=Xenorhabdus sp. TH1 TaxID=3130166 RepID=UPI0030D24EF4